MSKLQHWLLKRISKEEQAILNSKRVYILPTREGIIFSIMLLIMLSAAINYNNSLVFIFTFLMAGVAVISMQMTQKNLLGLQFSIPHTQPVFCNDILHIPVSIRQTGHSNTTSFSIAVSLESQHQFTDVPGGNPAQIQLTCKAAKRGRVNLPPLIISTIFPFGLFRAWANIKLKCDGIIYPDMADKVNFSPHSGIDNDGQSNQGRGYDDFYGFKSYQPGESLKHVHWKAFAKGQGMLTKTFSGGNSKKYWIKWTDISAKNLEDRLRKMCKIIVDAQNNGDQYGLILPAIVIDIDHGYQHQHQCLKALALFDENTESESPG